MKLSRTGWNNVIIFSVMAFILIINVVNKQLYSKNDIFSSVTEQYLLGNDSVILTLAINDNLLIERIGRSWRAVPPKLTGQALEQMMLAWQQSSGQVIEYEPEILQKSAWFVSITLAGKAEPMAFSLYSTKNELLVFTHHNKQWLSLPLPIFKQLLPQQITEEM